MIINSQAGQRTLLCSSPNETKTTTVSSTKPERTVAMKRSSLLKRCHQSPYWVRISALETLLINVIYFKQGLHIEPLEEQLMNTMDRTAIREPAWIQDALTWKVLTASVN